MDSQPANQDFRIPMKWKSSKKRNKPSKKTRIAFAEPEPDVVADKADEIEEYSTGEDSGREEISSSEDEVRESPQVVRRSKKTKHLGVEDEPNLSAKQRSIDLLASRCSP